MRCIIAGSRESVARDDVHAAIVASGWGGCISLVLCGGARGADTFGFDWAWVNGIPVKHFIPAWSQHGKKAGILRNIEMAENADSLIAVWDGESRGTKHMIEEATRRGLKVYVHRVGQEGD